MGLGIGKDCQRCSEQLNHGDGFNSDETLCKRCDSIVNYSKKHYTQSYNCRCLNCNTVYSTSEGECPDCFGTVVDLNVT